MPPHFTKAIEKLRDLQHHDEYIGAFIFGSVARNEVTADSDIDIKVITKNDSACTTINHALIEDIKLDITFLSLKQLENEKSEAGTLYRPMLTESLILFDKTGDLQKKKDVALLVQPQKMDPKMATLTRELIHSANVQIKFKAWKGLVERVTDGMGGLLDIEKMGCDCAECRGNIGNILGN